MRKRLKEKGETVLLELPLPVTEVRHRTTLMYKILIGPPKNNADPSSHPHTDTQKSASLFCCTFIGKKVIYSYKLKYRPSTFQKWFLIFESQDFLIGPSILFSSAYICHCLKYFVRSLGPRFFHVERVCLKMYC